MPDFDAIAAEFGDDPASGGPAQAFSCVAELWLWRADNPDVPAAWHFLTLDAATSAAVRLAAVGRTGGFGSIKVVARIGATEWRTSIFPNKQAGGYMLPVKATVRKAEGIKAGDSVTVTVSF